jgi:hypothetical protein
MPANIRRVLVIWRAYFFPVSPTAISRRMASDLLGTSSWIRRHASIASTSSGDIITGTRWSLSSCFMLKRIARVVQVAQLRFGNSEK